ncbi:MAG: porin family protein [Rhodobacteraceae bacterium]|nr:porin family protein [Paracoccaceae bacterium]
MKIGSKAALGLVLSGALAVPALAGSLSEPAAEATVAAPVATVAAGGDWTGGYVGAQIGYGDASAGAADGDGAVYGLRGGYDWDLGNWVVGAAVDWDQTDIDLGAGGDNLDNIARLKLRAGYDLGRTLVYGSAGIARADATIGGTEFSDNGWVIGLGADYALNDRWTIGGEIQHQRFDDFAGSATDIRATTASVNVGFRF